MCGEERQGTRKAALVSGLDDAGTARIADLGKVFGGLEWIGMARTGVGHGKQWRGVALSCLEGRGKEPGRARIGMVVQGGNRTGAVRIKERLGRDWSAKAPQCKTRHGSRGGDARQG